MLNPITVRIKKGWDFLSSVGKVLVAFVGGVAAIYGTYKLFFPTGAKPNFTMNSTTFGIGLHNQKDVYEHYLVEASIINSGDKPYYPDRYKLVVSFGYKSQTFIPYPISDSMKFKNSRMFLNDSGRPVGKIIPIPEHDTLSHSPKVLGMNYSIPPGKDLTRIIKIDPNERVTGYIDFVYLLAGKETLPNLAIYDHMQVEMIDVNQKSVFSNVYPFIPYHDQKGYFPQSGIESK